MLPGAAVRVIRRNQRELWRAARRIASPSFNIVLTRPGVGDLPPQEVVVEFRYKGVTRHQLRTGQDYTPSSDMTFRRLIGDDFDVKPGDRFTYEENAGIIVRVFSNKGVIHADARLVDGTMTKW